MVINKLFGKKDSKAGIDSLKERFSQVSQSPQSPGQSPQDLSQQNNQQDIPVQSSPVQVQDAIADSQQVQVPVQSQQPVPPAQPPQSPQVQPFGQQPLGATLASNPTSQVQVPVQEQQPASTVQPNQIPQAVPAPLQSPSVPQSNPAVDLPSWAVESAGEEIGAELGNPQASASSPTQNKAAQTLEQIEDKYYDAKLNSLIIDQVKELIEIDNNLNTRIDDASSEIKKEIAEREKLAKKVDDHFAKVKELETNMEKFLGLYEMVTNQFNPFVDRGSSELFLDDADKKYKNPVVQDPEHPQVQAPVQKQVEDPIPLELRAPVQNSSPQSQTPMQPQQQPASPMQQQADGSWKYCPIHHNIHPSLHFELRNGQKLSSIYDVLAVLEQMDDETFAAHVNLRQNDLSQWIYKVLGLTDLGQQLDLIKTRPEMIQSIRSYIQHKMKQANQV